RAKDVVLTLIVYQDPLENFVQVQRFARRVAVKPRQLPRIGIERQRGVGIQRRAIAGAAAYAHPRLGLRRPPVGQVQVRIVASRDPRLDARPESVRQPTPSVAAGFAFERDRSKTPRFLTGLGVIGADKALLFPIRRAGVAAESLNQ